MTENDKDIPRTVNRPPKETVYLLFGYDAYYPTLDNTIAVFDDKEEANRACELLKQAGVKEDRSNKFDWWPDYLPNTFEVKQYTVRSTHK